MKRLFSLLLALLVAAPCYSFELGSKVAGGFRSDAQYSSYVEGNKEQILEDIRMIAGYDYVQGLWVFDRTGATTTVADRKVVDVGSKYPPAYSGTYVKTTSGNYLDYYPYLATDPSKSLTGSAENNSWHTTSSTVTNQRFHIDLGSAKVIKKIYYENYVHNGEATTIGAKTFTFWGSNTDSAFATLTYATDTNWTQLTCSQATFDEHAAADSADPKYITVTNFTPYRYYAVKIANNWGSSTFLGLRRIELQTNSPAHDITLGGNANTLSPAVSGLCPNLTMAGTAGTSWSAGDSDDFTPGVGGFTIINLTYPTVQSSSVNCGKYGASHNEWGIFENDGNIGIAICGAEDESKVKWIQTASSSDTGAWHTYIGTSSSNADTSTLKFYKDGIDIGGSGGTVGSPFTIVNGTSTISNNFKGNISSAKYGLVAIISRELSAGEVKQISDKLLEYVKN